MSKSPDSAAGARLRLTALAINIHHCYALFFLSAEPDSEAAHDSEIGVVLHTTSNPRGPITADSKH